MLALYRGGRQVDALAVFQAVRLRTLADDLGLEPGPSCASSRVGSSGTIGSLGRRGASAFRSAPVGRRIFAAAASVAGLIAGLQVPFCSASRGLERPFRLRERRPARPAGRGRRAPGHVRSRSRAALGGRRRTAGAVWIADSADETVSRVDPASETVVTASRSAASREASPPAMARSGPRARSARRSSGSTRAPTPSPRRFRLGNAEPGLACLRPREVLGRRHDRPGAHRARPGSGSVLRTLSIDLQPTSIGDCRGRALGGRIRHRHRGRDRSRLRPDDRHAAGRRRPGGARGRRRCAVGCEQPGRDRLEDRPADGLRRSDDPGRERRRRARDDARARSGWRTSTRAPSPGSTSTETKSSRPSRSGVAGCGRGRPGAAVGRHGRARRATTVAERSGCSRPCTSRRSTLRSTTTAPPQTAFLFSRLAYDTLVTFEPRAGRPACGSSLTSHCRSRFRPTAGRRTRSGFAPGSATRTDDS